MMKSKIFSLMAGAAFIGIFFAFCGNSEPDVEAAVASVLIAPDPDTISTSSTTDSIIFDLGTILSYNTYAMQIQADSLSGGTTATCYLEISQKNTGNDWIAIKTVAVDGVLTESLETGDIVRGRARCLCAAPSSTQSTAVRVSLAFAPKP